MFYDFENCNHKLDNTLRGIKFDSTLPLFFAGSGKNSGKTTSLEFVHHFLHCRQEAVILMTIGRDGEEKDLFFDNPKPPISVFPGDLFITDEEGCLNTASNLLLPLAARVPGDGSRLGIWRCLNSGEVELKGSGSAQILWNLLDAARKLSTGKILVVGALDRWAALNEGDCELILCAGAQRFENIARATSWIRAQKELFTLPLVEKPEFSLAFNELDPIDDFPSRLYWKGPLTPEVFNRLKGKGVKEIVLNSPSHSFLSSEQLLKNLEYLALLAKPVLKAVALNPYSPAGTGFSPVEFRRTIKNELPELPVFDPLLLC
ncbi:MAG: hypothetical protein PF689_13050 [Deltaproteobacteria bacterium]|nr:hypothetical protein [Deltaproteobacteria bacterium]